MEVVLWVVGMGILTVAGVLIVRVFQHRAERMDQRFHVSEQAARWRHLQRMWHSVPGARLATVRAVQESSRRGCRATIGWAHSTSAQDVWIDRERVEVGDYILVSGVGPDGVVAREQLLARAAADAPRCAEKIH